MSKKAKWSGKRKEAGLVLSGKESRDALDRLNRLKPKWQKRFFNNQGTHKEGHNYIAWSNLSGELEQDEFIYPDDAIRWLEKLKDKHNGRSNK